MKSYLITLSHGEFYHYMKLVPNNSTSYAFFSKLVDASRHWDAMELIFGLVLVHTYV